MTQLIKIATLNLGGHPAYVYDSGDEGHRLFIPESVQPPAIEFYTGSPTWPKIIEAGDDGSPEAPCRECGGQVRVTRLDLVDLHECRACAWYQMTRREEDLP